MTRTLLVGLDAACWEYLDPLLQGGRLPVLRGLMDRGVWGVLPSTMPAHTPTAWASLTTGKNPGKHGVFDMRRQRSGSYEMAPTSARDRRASPFWKRLNDAGSRVGLVNVPFTHPPDRLDGFVVGGFGTPASAPDGTYPPEIIDWIRRTFGSYQPASPAEVASGAEPHTLLAEELRHQRRQVEIAVALAELHAPHHLAINLMAGDHANHRMPEMEQVETALCASDADLGQLIDRFGPDHVLVISDHGSRRVRGDFQLHAWLRDHGYLVQHERDRADGASAINWVLSQWLGQVLGRSGLSERALRRGLAAFLARMPDWTTRPLWRLIERSVPLARDHVRFTGEIDVTRSPLLLGTVFSGLLFVNLEGREPNGVVSREGLDEFLRELADRLAAIVDPETSRPLISHVYDRQTLYRGALLDRAPDLVLDAYDSPWNLVQSPRSGAVPRKPAPNRYFLKPPSDFGVHRRDGIFVFSGPAFRTGRVEDEVTLMDVTAILLHLHGVAVPDDYDGVVRRPVMNAKFMTDHPVRTQPGDRPDEFPNVDSPPPPEESAEIEKRLRMLGYLD